jgi:hypothetical protein
MQRCVKISKQSVKNFRRFKILNKRTFTFLFIYIDLAINDGSRTLTKIIEVCYSGLRLDWDFVYIVSCVYPL